MTNTYEKTATSSNKVINLFSKYDSIEPPSVIIIKKDGTREAYNIDKIIGAINKSAARGMYKFSANEINAICLNVHKKIKDMNKQEININEIHNIVEASLEEINPDVAKNYKDYRNYKTDFVGMLDKVYQESQRIMYIGDKENANADSTLVSTKRSLIFNELNKELYKKFFLSVDELQAIRDGYIYIHDMSARRDSMNCCLFDVSTVLKDGFEMGNIWYNEPKTLDVAFDVIGDIVMAAASQQYGGFTVPEVDKILAPYAQKTYEKQYDRYLNMGLSSKKAKQEALKDVQNDFEQGFQGWEYKFNTVASSRGDYPFITVTLGLGQDEFEVMATLACLKTRQRGQGKKECKKPVLFPKIVFLYDEELHGKGKPLEKLFKAGVECSRKTMYPDWLSLTGDGYVASIYKKYKRVVSPMGCVHGQEVITYKLDNSLYVESFERMWNRLDNKYTSQGQYFPDDINKFINCENLNVQIWDNKKQNFVKVNKLIRNRQDSWCEVTLTNGRILTCTTDHPFETENRGQVYANQLTTDDYISIDKNQYTENHIDYNVEQAWLEGFLLCDGCYQNYSIFASVAAQGEDDIAQACKDYMEKYFKLPSDIKLVERGKQGTYKNIHAYSDNKQGLTDTINYLTNLFGGVQKINRHIPSKVFSSKEDARYAFLAGIIDADGYIAYNHNKTNCKVQLGSTNKELAIQEALLAQSLGMRAQIYKTHYKGVINSDKISYKVEFYPSVSLISYLKCSKKKQRFIETTEDKNLNFETCRVKKVTLLEKIDYSYDVSTESEHFTVSGVYSHNCRAFLSPWYERGGMEPVDENDKPVFVGRFNIGAISLHLPMIYAKAKQESKDFYQVLDYYMELIRRLHIRTYEYLGEMKASVNPLAYCEGGFLGGHLKPSDKIKPLLKSATASFGITALNELQELYNGKSLVEDGAFAIEVMEYINKKVAEFKKEDGLLYALYGTPAENLCFHGDMEVQCYPSNKKIKDIKVGDLVYSANNENKLQLNKVVAATCTNEHAVVVKVKFDNGQEIICTPDHPIAVRRIQQDTMGKFVKETTEYVPARMLKPGTSVRGQHIGNKGSHYYKNSYEYYTEDCKNIAEANHQVVSVEYLQELIPVYNIEVENNHNYFVGGNEGVLVHNCGLQVKQFRKKYGIVENVSDRPYVSNSFHCHVSENITPIEKQDLEKRFWDLMNGGKIQYVKYPIDYNIEAIETLIHRAMDMGFYEGVNLSLSYCDDCGHEELNMDVCPKCGSRNLTKIDRMNGYLAYSRVKGDSRLADHKMEEIKNRVSM